MSKLATAFVTLRLVCVGLDLLYILPVINLDSVLNVIVFFMLYCGV